MAVRIAGVEVKSRQDNAALQKLVSFRAVIKMAMLTRLPAATMFLSIVGSAALLPADARAQVMELGFRRLVVTKEELRALSNLGILAQSSGPTAFQDRALAEARRIANGRDARHVLALYELEIGGRRRDNAMRARALDVLIPSQLTEREKLPKYLMVRGQIAFLADDFDVAGSVWSRLAKLTPSDPDVFAGLAQVRLANKDTRGAMESITHAITAREAIGQAAPEAWHRQRLSIAQQGQLVGPGIDAARALVAGYPTPANWRDTLVVYRELVMPEGAFEIDLLRFMRHIGTLVRAAEYRRMAQLLRRAGEPREAKAVLDEGVTRGLLDAGTWPTREIIEEVDRAIVEARRGSETKPDLSNKAAAQVRLGMAKILAGRRAEAEVAFRAAAGYAGERDYADLASFWLLSLLPKEENTRPAPSYSPSPAPVAPATGISS